MRVALSAWLLFLCALASADLAAQTASPSTGCLPFEAAFTPPSSGSSFWDFGDGVNSNLNNPTHVYTAAGTYRVEYRRTAGGPILGTTTVRVFATPTLSIEPETLLGCAPAETGFRVSADLDPSIRTEAYNWTLGDGGSARGDTITYTYERPGTYDVAVALQTNFATCNVTEIFSAAASVVAPPEVTVLTDPQPAQSCEAPLLVTVRSRVSGGLAPYSYDWDLGNGDSSAQANPGLVSYPTAGGYQIALTVTDANGCVATALTPVSVGGPDANFVLPDTVCLGQEYTIAPLGTADFYDYTFGPNVESISASDDGREQTVRFTSAGATTVSLEVTNSAENCTADTTRELFVQRVGATATGDPSTVCSAPFTVDYSVIGDGVSAVWEFGQGQGSSTALDTAVNYEYDQGGEYGYNSTQRAVAGVLLTDAAGCVLDTSVVTLLYKPNARFVPDVHQGCAPLTVNFFDSTRANQRIISYVIDWGDGNQETINVAGPWQHTYAATGDYEATLTIDTEDGCTDTSYPVAIEVGAPVGGLSYTTDIDGDCPGDTLTFVNTSPSPLIDAVHFEVGGGHSSMCFNSDTLRHVVRNAPGTTELPVVLYAEYNGCVDSLVDAVPYTPGPIAKLGYAVECATPFDVRLFNRSEASATDSVRVRGLEDSTFATALAILDSADLTLPARGAYQAILVARDPSSACGPSFDTVEFYVTVPIANFDLPDQLCTGVPLDLDGSASQDVNATCGLGYQWEFTFDRPYSTDQAMNSEVSASARGPQTVDLIVTDINDCRDTASVDVDLFGSELTVTAVDDRICIPETVRFDLSAESDTTVTSYNWDFAGQGTSSVQNPSFQFTDPGDSSTLVVSVATVDALGCPGSGSVPISVYRPRSTVTTLPDPALICTGETIDFTATQFTEEGSSLTYAWDFGNGQTSTTQDASATYPAAGTFPASLVYTEVASGCQNDTTVNVEVQTAPTAAFTSDIDDNEINCYPTLATFTDESTSASETSALWLTGGVTATGPTFSNSFDRGTQTVALISSTSAGCRDTVSRDYEFTGPVGDILQEPAEICVGEEVTFTLIDTIDVESFTWDLGNGETIDDQTSVTTTYDFRPTGGETVVSVTLRAASSVCTFTATSDVQFLDIAADFVTDLGSESSCGPEVTLVDRSRNATTYAYDFGDAGTSTESSPSVTFPGPGSYDIRLVVGNDNPLCADTTTKSITVLEPLQVGIEAGAECINGGSVITLDPSRPLSSAAYSPANLIASQSGNSATTVTLTENTTVSVLARDTFGCETTVTVDVESGGGYTGRGDTLTVIEGGSVTLDVQEQEGYTFRWLDPDAVGSETSTSPSVSPQATTDYVIEVSDAGDCGTRLLIFRVIVVPAPIIPNLFTPNGDGSNDDWGPLIPEGAVPTVDRYEVYDRWGGLVFQGESIEDRWTGDRNGNGKEAVSDVYAYVLVFNYDDGSTFETSGEITLLR